MTHAVKAESVIATFAAGLHAAKSLEEAVDALHGATLHLGYRRATYARGSLPSFGKQPASPAKIIARDFPSDWQPGYSELGQFDPYFRVTCNAMTGTDWTQIHESAHTFSKPVRAFIAWARDLGLREGFTVPVRTSPLLYAAVSAIDPVEGWTAEELLRSRDLITVISNHFVNEVTRRFDSSPQSAVVLCKRETECLYWFAQGKTIEDIGSILAISTETVRTYFKRTNAKLETVSRAHALAKAMSLGLIDVNAAAAA